MPPTISIIIPVLHESHIINRLIRHLLHLPFAGKREILVVDGDASGDSLKAIREPQVRKIISVPGRGAQMNAGAGHATGDILLFLHADTFLPEDGLGAAADAMTATDAVGGAFDLAIDSPHPLFRWIENSASIRTRITRVPYGDQAIFIRREYFRRIGGFRAFPIMEDVELMQRIRKRGDRILLLRRRVRTSPRRWEKKGICANTLRNWMLLALYHLGVSPHRLYRRYH